MKPYTTQPLVSIIITAYNEEQYISDAMASMLAQTYRNIEVIVVDDGSTDATYKILKQYRAIDKRVKIIRAPKNVGPSMASNMAMKIARGTYIARMDADDTAVRERIEKQVAYLIKHPDVIMVGSMCYLTDEHGAIIEQKRYPLAHQGIYNSLFSFNPMLHQSCLINRKLLPRGVYFYPHEGVLAHDLELVFDLAQYGKLANMDDAFIFYRRHHGSFSLSDPKATFHATVAVRMKALKQYGYKPTLNGWCSHWGQVLVMSFLPTTIIYPLFQFYRMNWASRRRMVTSIYTRMYSLIANSIGKEVSQA